MSESGLGEAGSRSRRQGSGAGKPRRGQAPWRVRRLRPAIWRRESSAQVDAGLAPRLAEAQGVTCLERRDGAESKGCGHAAPLSEPVKGKPSPGAAAPAGCTPKRACPASTASPGPRRPQGSRRPWEPGRLPCPARALAVDHYVAPTEAPPNQVRPLGIGPPSFPSRRLRHVHAGEDRQRRVDSLPRTRYGVPACLSRRASWTLWDKLGVSVVAFSGSSLNSAAMSRSTSSSRLRRGRTSVIVRLPAANVAVVIVHLLKCFCFVTLPIAPACGQRRRADPVEEPTLALSGL